jgi:hypothetical protein
MKPSEHPEFFRFPPPEGRSRESSIVLTRDGRFFHDGAPVEHPGMKKAFASWLTRHPDDGRDILSNGYDWTYLTVEGARRFVQSVRDVAGRPALTLLDGRELALEPAGLSCDEEVEHQGAVGLQIGGQFSAIAGPGTRAGAQP